VTAIRTVAALGAGLLMGLVASGRLTHGPAQSSHAAPTLDPGGAEAGRPASPYAGAPVAQGESARDQSELVARLARVEQMLGTLSARSEADQPHVPTDEEQELSDEALQQARDVVGTAQGRGLWQASDKTRFSDLLASMSEDDRTQAIDALFVAFNSQRLRRQEPGALF
jgi:hypothetical protein